MLAKQAAREAGAFEAWFVDRDGFVTEGASTNAWIVDADGVLATRQTDQTILRGVTRAVIDVVAAEGLRVRGAPVHAARRPTARARPSFPAPTTIVMPVVAIDGRPIGDGRPGPLTLALRRKFADRGGAQLKRGIPVAKPRDVRIAAEMI